MRAQETHTRSVMKALTYRILAFAYLFLIARYLIHLSMYQSIGIALLDLLFKLGVYYLNERVWSHISFGYSEPEFDVLEGVLDDG